MPRWFNEEQARAGLGGLGHLAEKRSGSRQLVHHGECQREVHHARQVRDTQRIGRCQTRVHAVENPGLGRAAPEPIEHAGLNVNGDHPARCAHHTGHLQRKETHSGTGFEHGHAGADVRPQHCGRWVEDPAHGARQHVTQPPRTDAVRPGDGLRIRHAHFPLSAARE